MATKTLEGVSDNSVACSRYSGPYNVTNINDGNVLTYVYKTGGTAKDLYNLADCGLSDVTISNVAIHFWYATSGDINGYVDPILKSGGTEYVGTRRTGVSEYTEVSDNWPLNPDGNVAWTPTTIDALIFGYTLYGGSNNTLVREAEIVVTYTQNASPTVTTTAITAKRPKTATSGGEVVSSDTACSDAGLCWNLTGSPVKTDSHTHDSSGIGAFTSYMTGLLPGRTYHVRAWATNTSGTGYGAEVDFTTPAAPQIIGF